MLLPYSSTASTYSSRASAFRAFDSRRSDVEAHPVSTGIAAKQPPITSSHLVAVMRHLRFAPSNLFAAASIGACFLAGKEWLASSMAGQVFVERPEDVPTLITPGVGWPLAGVRRGS